MADPRHEQLARVLVHYSLEIKPGDKFLIRAGEAAAPLIREIYREALRAGAFVETQIALSQMARIFYTEAGDEQLQHLSELDQQAIEYYDASLALMSSTNTKELSHVDPAKMALSSRAQQTLMQRLMERAAANEHRWSVSLFPTYAYAQDAGMSLADFEEFVYGACLLNSPNPVEAWKKVYADQQRIVDYLMKHDEIHIIAPGTDVTYRVGGRTWINAGGQKNFPDGEVFTGPHEQSVNGEVSFTYPAVFQGNEVQGVHVRFENGKAVEATAARGQDFLIGMLDTDEGSRYLGEVAFGLNYGIQRFTHNILFDEKIGGTMHMAFGMAYPDTGATNHSALHWDMICDLREGQVFADGQLCYEHGKFII